MSLIERTKVNAVQATKLVKSALYGNGIFAYWWIGKQNFGDLFTPELIREFGYIPVHKSIGKARAIGAGSLLQMLPEDYSGTILGSGVIKEKPLSLPNANFAFVRGELTKKMLRLPSTVVTGDLGLLANHLLDRSIEKQFEFGIIPHYVDKNNPWIEKVSKELGSKSNVIDVESSAKTVIEQIAQCQCIISSSLHGIITSDALGIPNAWIELSDKVVGGGFKFRDYNTSIDFEQRSIMVTPDTPFSDIEKIVSEKNYTKINEKSEALHKHFLSTLSTLSSR